MGQSKLESQDSGEPVYIEFHNLLVFCCLVNDQIAYRGNWGLVTVNMLC